MSELKYIGVVLKTGFNAGGEALRCRTKEGQDSFAERK